MNWKCLFFHDYKTEMSNIVQLYSKNESCRPYHAYTNFLYKCSRCNKRKVEKLDGSWVKKDDDDDDDRDPPNLPVMSPDDFYESLNKGI